MYGAAKALWFVGTRAEEDEEWSHIAPSDSPALLNFPFLSAEGPMPGGNNCELLLAPFPPFMPNLEM